MYNQHLDQNVIPTQVGIQRLSNRATEPISRGWVSQAFFHGGVEINQTVR